MIDVKDVMPDSSPTVKEDDKPTPEILEGKEEEKAPAGSKTPDTQLLAALKEEREQRKALQERIKQLENPTPASPEEEVFSDEGKTLKKLLDQQNVEIRALKEEKEIEKVLSSFPDLRGATAEFNEFRASYPGVSLEKTAKLFLHEKGLLDAPARKGLENPSGGSRTPSTTGLTQEDVKRLRETQPRRYQKMVMEGKIKAEDIK